MIDHGTARRLAARRIDGALDPAAERALIGHLAGCLDCRTVADGYRLDAHGLSVLTAIAAPASLRTTVLALPDRRRSTDVVPWLRIALAAALLTITLGALAYVGSRLLDIEPNRLFDPVRAYAWQTDVVSLEAGSLVIDAGGRRFTGAGADFAVNSDPGDAHYWTLEIEWFEQGLEQRMYLYFGADDATWWIDEIRTYDGVAIAPGGDWASFPRGPYARTPLGGTWTGTLDAVGSGRAGTVRLHLGDVVLRPGPAEAFAAPPDGGIVLRPGSRPFAVDGPLHCSGILQLSPALAHAALLERGYRVSWRLIRPTPEPWLVLVEPPEGMITANAPVVGRNGAIIIAVAPFGHPDASLVAYPADCTSP